MLPFSDIEQGLSQWVVWHKWIVELIIFSAKSLREIMQGSSGEYCSRR